MMMTDVDIHGHCDDRFDEVRTAFKKNFRESGEIGAACAVAIDGEFVVDLWGGLAEANTNRPWQKDTIVPVSSSTKVPVALCALMLVDRGLVDLDAPVARYWPEFAHAGKDRIPVRYLFSHASGVAGWDTSIDLTTSWEELVEKLAAQAPWWEPGTASGYHAITFGFLLGEIIQRVTGEPFLDFFHREMRDHAGADVYIQPPESEYGRIAEIVEHAPREIASDPNSIAARVYQPARDFAFSTGAIIKENFPSGAGITNARGLAQIGQAFVRGEHNGHHFLRRDTIEQVYEEQTYDIDLATLVPVRYGLGVGLASNEYPFPFPHVMHWGGAGGSTIMMEPDRRASWAYTPNYFIQGFGGDRRGARLVRATVSCVERLG